MMYLEMVLSVVQTSINADGEADGEDVGLNKFSYVYIIYRFAAKHMYGYLVWQLPREGQCINHLHKYTDHAAIRLENNGN